MKIGLVLEGGGMRGMFTCGALDVLMEQGVRFDGVMGVSAGALFGVNFLSGQHGRGLRYNQTYNADKKYMGWRVLLKTGNFFDTDYAYGRVPRKLDPFDDEAFKASGVPFFAVVTNLQTGDPEYIQIHSVFEQMDALRASGSLPFLSTPVILGKNRYLDGGVADPIPFSAFSDYDKLVVVLTREKGYRKQPASRLPIKWYYRKYPAFCNSMFRRHETYNNSLDRLAVLEREGRAFVLRPRDPVAVGRIERDPAKLKAAYDQGVLETTARTEELLQFLTP